MRGFASRIVAKTQKDDAVFVWFYRKNAEPFECNTLNVGVERGFYREGEFNVDDDITDLEKKFAPFVNRIRELEDGAKISDRIFLEFIVHLTLRTKHIRESLIDVGAFANDNLLGHFADQQKLRNYLVRLLTNRRDILMDAFEKDLKKINVAKFKKLLARVFIKYAPSQLLIRMVDAAIPEMAESFKSAQVHIAQNLKQIAKQAHIQSLLKNLVPEPRVEFFQQLHWHIRRPKEPLILGDVCCLFRMSNSQYVSIGGSNDEIERVYLPISQDCLIVGDRNSELPSICVAELNEASAKVSRNYFISSLSSPDMLRLSKLIDTEADLLSESEMEQLLGEAWSESLKKQRG